MEDALPIVIHHPWQEVASWWSQIIVAIVVFATAIFTAIQVRMLADAQRQEYKLARAQFLLELDKKWDSTEMWEARTVFTQMVADTTSLVGRQNPMAREEERHTECQRVFAETLATMRTNNYRDYRMLLRMCGFFETAGLMVKKRYASPNDIMALFRGPIIEIDMCFRKHIDDRAREMGVPNGLFENALFLCDLAKKP
jgi:hypothetical protein